MKWIRRPSNQQFAGSAQFLLSQILKQVADISGSNTSLVGAARQTSQKKQQWLPRRLLKPKILSSESPTVSRKISEIVDTRVERTHHTSLDNTYDLKNPSNHATLRAGLGSSLFSFAIYDSSLNGRAEQTQSLLLDFFEKYAYDSVLDNTSYIHCVRVFNAAVGGYCRSNKLVNIRRALQLVILVKFCPKIVSPNPDTNESFEPFSRAVLSLGLLREITTNGFGKDINSVTFRGLILLAAQDNEKHPTIARQAKSILMHEIVKIQKETKKSPGMKNGTKVKDLINAETCVALLRPMKSCIKHQTVEEVNEMELFLCSNGFDYLTESFDCISDSKRFDNTGNRFHDVNEDFNCISGVQLSSNVSLDRTIENSKPIRKFNESALTALIASIVTPNDSKTKSLYSNSMTSMTNSRHQKDRDCIIPSGSRAIQLLTKARCGSNQCYINSSHLNVLIKTLLKANHFGCLRLAQQLWCESQYSNVSNTLGKNTSAKLLHMLCDFYTADKKRSIVNSSITKYSITPLINYYLYTINDNGDAILNNKSKKNKQLSKENIRQHFNSNLVQALCRACGLCGDIENVRYFIDCFQNDETSSQPKSFLKSSEIRVAVRALTDVGGLREAFHLLKKNSNFAIHSKNADQKRQAEFNWSILFDCIEKDVDLDVARDAMHFMIIRQNLFPDVDGNIRKSLDNMMVRLASARRRIHLAEQSNLNLSDRVVSKQHFPVLGFAGLESEQQSNNNILSKQNVSNQPVMNDSILRGDVAFDISNILWPLQEDIEEDTSSEATSCEAQNRKEYKSKTVMMDKNTKSKDESKSYASAYISKHMSSETISSSLQLIAAEGSHLLQSDHDDCRTEILEEHVDNMFDLLENVLFEWDPRLIISH